MSAPAPAVATTGLCVEFDGQRVLDDITVSVEPGSFVAIVGPNGAGKTTLLRVLLGLVSPTAGQASLFGHPASTVDSDLIDHVPQAKALDHSFPARAVDFVSTASHGRWPFWIGEQDRDRAASALARVGGEALLNRSLQSLSGGELQRVYLARALMRAPRVLLLDEPATGIDLAGAADLYDVLENDQANRGTTVIMVTHDWTAAYHHASDVLLLDGTQVSFGPPDVALKEEYVRDAFGHTGHAHAMLTAEQTHVD